MKKIFYVVSSFAVLSIPLFVSAQDTFGNTGTGNTGTGAPPSTNINFQITNPFKGGNTLIDIVVAVLQNIVMPIAAVVVVLAIIYSGFKYLTAQGKPEAIKQANTGLMYVLIGAAILLGATGISAAIKGTICGSLIAC